MDKGILKKFAIESRQDLMNKISNKIKTFYVNEELKKEQKGEVYLLSNEKHSLSLTKEENDKRDLLIKRINELTLEQVIEEAAYTWFNRIIAIRYMEINDMLPLTKNNSSLGIRVLSSKDNTPDPEILKFTNLTNPDLDINFKKEKYIELKDDNKKFKYILLLICKKLGKVIPQVFDGITDYIDILIPDNLLNDAGFINKIINDVPLDFYNDVEIIGWLYQYYISERKEVIDKKVQNKERIIKEELPAKTQLFTPDWVVKYMLENSLGRKLIEISNNESLKSNYKYYIDDELNFTQDRKIEEIKFIDPCCGSGHILVYAFDLFYSAYINCGYNKSDIPKLIIKNNIFGLDVDDRAGQLSTLSLLLKARKYDKNLFGKDLEPNICSIQESNLLSSFYLDDFKKESTIDIIDYLIDRFIDAKEYGSLLDVENKQYDILLNIVENADNIFSLSARNIILPIIKQAKIMSQKFDIVVTNPPYLGTGSMSVKLNKYIKKYYPDSKNDMFAAFVEKCYKMTENNSYYALITQPSILFLNYFEKLRKKIIENQSITSLLHMGRGIFGVDFGSTAFVIKNNKNDNYIGKYFKLHKKVFQLIDLEEIEKLFLLSLKSNDIRFDFDAYAINNSFELCLGKGEKIVYLKNQKDFKDVPGIPFAYWVNHRVGEIFAESKKIRDIAEPRAGMQTGENNKFTRLWYEVSNDNSGLYVKNADEALNSEKKWFRYNKGGFFRKWYGNNEYVVNWQNDGYDIKEDKLQKLAIGKCLESNSKPKNMQYYFKESLTWSFVSSNSFSIRYSQEGAIFDIAGSSVFPKKDDIYYLLGFLGSNISMEFMKLQNPTLNFQVGNVANLPVIYNNDLKEKIKNIVIKNINLSKMDWDSFETSWDFKKQPLLEFKNSMPGLHDSNVDVHPVHLKVIVNNYGEQQFIADELPLNAKIEFSFKSWKDYCTKQFLQLKQNEEELNRIFIDIYGLQDELTPDVEDKDITIRKADRTREIKSLISYAVGCMFGRYSLDEDGLIYAGGEFDSSKYKTFNADNDNIIPITDEAYFNDDIVTRFKQFIEVVYGKETLNENLDYIAETLGKKGTETSEDTIRRYFVNDFYNDHIKTYQKRPIYWLFDSGKKNGFKCLIYMHRYSKELVASIRTKYIPKVQTTYDKLLSYVEYKLSTDLSLADKKEMEKKKIELNGKIQEVKEYYEMVANVANQMIDIDLDDGVVVNYAKFTYLNPKTNKEESILGKIK